MAKNIVKLIKEMQGANSAKLDLSGMGLKIFPEQLYELKDLEYLDISNNSLVTLPLEVGKLENLKYLDLRNNRIKYLPQFLNCLADLEMLCLDECLQSRIVDEDFKNINLIYGYPKVKIA